VREMQSWLAASGAYQRFAVEAALVGGQLLKAPQDLCSLVVHFGLYGLQQVVEKYHNGEVTNTELREAGFTRHSSEPPACTKPWEQFNPRRNCSFAVHNSPANAAELQSCIELKRGS
jgi:hypothetical protein